MHNLHSQCSSRVRNEREASRQYYTYQTEMKKLYPFSVSLSLIYSLNYIKVLRRGLKENDTLPIMRANSLICFAIMFSSRAVMVQKIEIKYATAFRTKWPRNFSRSVLKSVFLLISASDCTCFSVMYLKYTPFKASLSSLV